MSSESRQPYTAEIVIQTLLLLIVFAGIFLVAYQEWQAIKADDEWEVTHTEEQVCRIEYSDYSFDYLPAKCRKYLK